MHTKVTVLQLLVEFTEEWKHETLTTSLCYYFASFPKICNDLVKFFFLLQRGLMTQRKQINN